jgi:hypothetical protein
VVPRAFAQLLSPLRNQGDKLIPLSSPWGPL